MISVVVPVYNKSKYLNNTLRSLDKQTTDDFEIVFVDDCSTDDSLEMINSFKKSSKKKVKIIEKETNTGVCDTRNIGVKEANGEYITFLDADDLLDKNFIKIGYDKLRKNSGIDIIRAQVVLLENGKKNNYRQIKYRNNKIIVPRKNRDFFVNEIAACYGRLYHSSLVNSIDFVESGFEDHEYSLESMIRCNELLNVNSMKYYYNMIQDGRYEQECKNIKKNCLDYLDIYDRINEHYTLSDFTKETLRLKKIRSCFIYLRKVLDSKMDQQDKKEFVSAYLIYLKTFDGLDRYMIGDGRNIIDKDTFDSIPIIEDRKLIRSKIKQIASKY